MDTRVFVAIAYVIGMFVLLMPVYDQLVPIEPSEEVAPVTITDVTYIYEVDVPVTASQYPLTRCGYCVDAYRFTEPDECIRLLAGDIESQTGLSGYWLVEYYRNLVHNIIGYRLDDDAHGRSEYWQLPSETLLLGTGDCEDKAFLFISLCRASGFDCIIVLEPGHVSVGVDVEGDGRRISYGGTDYLVADPTKGRFTGYSDPDVRYVYGTCFGREQFVFFTVTAFLIAVVNYYCIFAIMRT